LLEAKGGEIQQILALDFIDITTLTKQAK